MLFRAAPARLANADHLYGFSAECGLKWLMTWFGMTVDDATGRPKDGDDRRHIDDIWRRYESYRSSHPLGAAYTLPPTTPFADWKAEQRYANRNGFDPARVQGHRDAADLVRNLISQARKDGLI